MPRVASLSTTSTVEPTPRSPRARIVARFRAMWLIVLLTWVTRRLAGIGGLRGRLAGGVQADRHAAPLAERLGGAQAHERLDGRPGHVDRVRRAVDLREDVADAGRLDDGPDRATGNDAGALAGGLQEHVRRGVDVADLVGDRRPDHRDPDEVLLGILDALPD